MLLQPISASDERPFPSLVNNYQYIDDSRLLSAAGERDIDESARKIRKKSRTFKAKPHVDSDDDENVPRQASKIDYENSDEEKGSKNRLYPGPNRSAGYLAPLGMQFVPMCSACDESTDGE